MWPDKSGFLIFSKKNVQRFFSIKIFVNIKLVICYLLYESFMHIFPTLHTHDFDLPCDWWCDFSITFSLLIIEIRVMFCYSPWFNVKYNLQIKNINVCATNHRFFHFLHFISTLILLKWKNKKSITWVWKKNRNLFEPLN